MSAACKEAVAPPQFLTNWQSAAVLSVCLLVCMGVFQTVQSDTATLSIERYSAGQTDCSLCAMAFGFSLPEMQNSSLRFMREIAIWT